MTIASTLKHVGRRRRFGHAPLSHRTEMSVFHHGPVCSPRIRRRCVRAHAPARHRAGTWASVRYGCGARRFGGGADGIGRAGISCGARRTQRSHRTRRSGHCGALCVRTRAGRRVGPWLRLRRVVLLLAYRGRYATSTSCHCFCHHTAGAPCRRCAQCCAPRAYRSAASLRHCTTRSLTAITPAAPWPDVAI